MEMVTESEVTTPVCQANQFAQHVDDVLNGAAVREAEESTSETQESGADLDEGNAYLDDTSPTFERRDARCDSCLSVVSLYSDGSIAAPTCNISKSCESDWIAKYPDEYREADGKPTTNRLICGAEIGCSAVVSVIEVDGAIKPEIKRGACKVTSNGDEWREMFLTAISEAECESPDVEMSFDGEEIDPDEELHVVDDSEELRDRVASLIILDWILTHYPAWFADPQFRLAALE